MAGIPADDPWAGDRPAGSPRPPRRVAAALSAFGLGIACVALASWDPNPEARGLYAPHRAPPTPRPTLRLGARIPRKKVTDDRESRAYVRGDGPRYGWDPGQLRRAREAAERERRKLEREEALRARRPTNPQPYGTDQAEQWPTFGHPERETWRPEGPRTGGKSTEWDDGFRRSPRAGSGGREGGRGPPEAAPRRGGRRDARGDPDREAEDWDDTGFDDDSEGDWLEGDSGRKAGRTPPARRNPRDWDPPSGPGANRGGGGGGWGAYGGGDNRRSTPQRRRPP